jgi:hypothetical protein
MDIVCSSANCLHRIFIAQLFVMGGPQLHGEEESGSMFARLPKKGVNAGRKRFDGVQFASLTRAIVRSCVLEAICSPWFDDISDT